MHHSRSNFSGRAAASGVPMLACPCAVCASPDPRDKRLRTSALITVNDRHLLIDASPDLRAQGIDYGVNRVDAVLFTHDHADHVGGIDDLRAYNLRNTGKLSCYGDARTLAAIQEPVRLHLQLRTSARLPTPA